MSEETFMGCLGFMLMLGIGLLAIVMSIAVVGWLR